MNEHACTDKKINRTPQQLASPLRYNEAPCWL